MGRPAADAPLAGVGMVSLRSLLARRVVRILDSSRVLSTRAGSGAVLAMLAAGLAGTLLAGLLGVGEGKQTVLAQTQAPAEGKAVETKPALKDKTIRGQVLGPDGKPVPKAAPVDVPINGRIVDLEGRPVAGVSVKVEQFQGPKGDDLTPWIDAVKKGGRLGINYSDTPYRHIDFAVKIPENARRKATTDKDGRFRLEGLGGERVVDLAIRGDTVAFTSINVVTRGTEPFAAPGFVPHYGPGTVMIYGADFTYAAQPSRLVEGTVRDARTNLPRAGMEVQSYQFAGSNVIAVKALKTITDAQGRFRLASLPKGKGNLLIVVPNDDQPYFMQEVRVPDPPGITPVAIEVALHRGIWIEGKVTEEATGAPVAEARLCYFPFLENPFARATPEFHAHGNVDGVGLQRRYMTKPNGTYRLVGLPGRAIVGVEMYKKPYRQGVGAEAIKGMNERGHFETWRNVSWPGKLWPTAMKEINPPGDAELVHLDIVLSSGASVRLRVVDPDGAPVTGVTTAGRTNRGIRGRDAAPDAKFDVITLAPGEDRLVMVRHDGRKLGKVVHVREGDDKAGPVLVTLAPLATITGRVADADGNPVPGARVRPALLPAGDFSLSLPQVTTDQEGRFRVPDVPTGCDYALAVESLEAIKKRRFAFSSKDITVKPGEMADVGEIRFKND